MGCTGIRSGTVSVVTPPSAPGHEMTACSSRSPDTCGCTCQLNRMLTSSPMDLSIVSSGVTVASEAITDSLARTIVPTVTVTGRGSRGTSVGTVALIMAWRRWASPMLSAMLSVCPSAKKAGACHSALRVIMRCTSGGAGAGGATVKARDGLGPGGAGGAARAQAAQVGLVSSSSVMCSTRLGALRHSMKRRPKARGRQALSRVGP